MGRSRGEKEVYQPSDRVRGHIEEGISFLKWLLYACSIGVLVGVVGVAFYYGIDWATQLRGEVPRVVWLLPAGGVSIVLIYRICHMERDRGTNLVLVAVREAEPMKLRTAPLIFLSTIITHLVGGSAGREGAALQLGGSLAAFVGRQIRLDQKDGRVMVMCGMAAAFSALFGTPLTAAIFAMEVVSVGVMYYAAIVPCVSAALVSLQVAQLCGIHSHGYEIGPAALLGPATMVQTAVLGVLCALVSILFCKVMHAAPKLYAKYFPNPLVRAAVGGALVLLLTLLAFVLYRLTGCAPLSFGLEAVGAAALAAVYFYKKSLLDRALTHLLGKIVLADVFNTVVNDHILDLGGLLYYVSAAFIMLFLTVQTIEKRRWS